jgi:hypothetical protein
MSLEEEKDFMKKSTHIRVGWDIRRKLCRIKKNQRKKSIDAVLREML